MTLQYPRILILTKEKKRKNIAMNSVQLYHSWKKMINNYEGRWCWCLPGRNLAIAQRKKLNVLPTDNRILLFVEITYYIWLKSLFSLQCLETGIQMSNWFVNWTYEFLFLTTNESMRLGECLISSYELGTNSFPVRIKIVIFHNGFLSSYMNVNGNWYVFLN